MATRDLWARVKEAALPFQGGGTGPGCQVRPAGLGTAAASFWSSVSTSVKRGEHEGPSAPSTHTVPCRPRRGTSWPRERLRLECDGSSPAAGQRGWSKEGMHRSSAAGGAGRQEHWGREEPGGQLGLRRLRAAQVDPASPRLQGQRGPTTASCLLHATSPAPGPQANGFPFFRENRGSLQSCSELNALSRASWSVSRQPGSRGATHGHPHLHSVLSHPSEAAHSPAFVQGLPAAPHPDTCLPTLGRSLLGPLLLNGHSTCAGPPLLPLQPCPELTAAKRTRSVQASCGMSCSCTAPEPLRTPPRHRPRITSSSPPAPPGWGWGWAGAGAERRGARSTQASDRRGPWGCVPPPAPQAAGPGFPIWRGICAPGRPG